MSDDRLAQARAEAERRYPHHGEDIGDAYGYGHFMDGWLAADANPQPHTITLAQSEESIERAALGIHASHDRGDWDEELPVVQAEYRDMARAALAAALGEDESDG